MKAKLTIQSIGINVIHCRFADVYEPGLVMAIAQKILDAGGLARPLVVLSTKGTYELEEGVLEYYASLKAHDINPRRMLFVNCVVINKAAILPACSQLQLLNSQIK